jgi:hypothetical protein
MARPVVSLLEKARDSLIKKSAQKAPVEKHICYVLIACGEPSENGEMEVEMTYEGDKALASYLLQSAQGLLEE